MTGLSAQEATITEACVPIEIAFTAEDGRPAYFWDFKDSGVTSSEQNPLHIFPNPGVYEVELREGRDGPVVGTVTINLYPKPVLDLTTDTMQACAGTPIQFTNLSEVDENIAVTNYTWVYGDGTIENTLDDPTHVYDAQNIISVSLLIETATENCDVSTRFEELLDIRKPVAEFETAPEDLSICTPPLRVDFVNNSFGTNLVYDWQYGNGESSDVENPATIVYTEAIDQEITLTVTDDIGCTNTTSKAVVVGQPNAVLTAPDTVCVGQITTVLNMSDPGDIIFNFGGAEIVRIFEDDLGAELIFPEEGLYTLMVTVIVEGGCRADSSITVYADQIDISFVSEPDYTCNDSLEAVFTATVPDRVALITWIFPDTIITGDAVQNYTIRATDTSKYTLNRETLFFTTLRAVTDNGCTATFTASDTIHRPDARFAPDVVSGCAPLTVVFSDSSQGKEDLILYEWDFGDGTTITADSAFDQTHTYTEPGDYPVELVVTNDVGCFDTSYCVIIRVGEQFVSDVVIAPTEICAGDSILLINNTTNAYERWSYNIINGVGEDCPGDSAMIGVPVDAGVYDIAVLHEQAGCVSNDTLVGALTVRGFNPEPYYEVDCENPFTVAFADSTTDAATRSWTLNDEVISTENSFDFTFDSTGDYRVFLTLTDPTGTCPDVIDSIDVFIREIQSIFELAFEQCFQQPFDLTSSMSQDVYDNCYSGYKWVPTDQRPIVTEEDTIMYSFQDTGNHSLTLIVNDINGCTDTSVVNVKVYNIVADIDVDPLETCLPRDFTLRDLSVSDTTITTWVWTIGDMMFDTEDVDVTIDEFGEDEIPVTLLVQNAAGCPSTALTSIRIYDIESQIVTTPSIPQICVGESIEFFATDFIDQGSFLTYEWDFGNGQTGSQQRDTIRYDEPGNYTVRLSYTEDASGCSEQATILVQVQDFPIVAFNSTPGSNEEICPGTLVEFMNMSQGEEPLALLWDLGNGDRPSEPNPSTTYNPGEYVVQLIAVTTFGCADTATDVYTIADVQGDFTVQPDQLCEGTEVTFTITDTMQVDSWVWDFGNGGTAENVSPVTEVFDMVIPGSTVARLILRGSNGCEFTVEKPLTIEDISASFEVAEMPDSSFCVMPTQFINTSSSNSTIFTWDFGDGESGTEREPSHLFPGPGNYTVTLTAENERGCIETTSRTVVVLITALGDLQMPLAFSPNGDQLNDFFQPVLSDEALRDLVIIEKFQVFNRWGEMVYDNQNGMQGWNGRYEGEVAPSEAYYYFISLNVDGCDLNVKLEGDVTVLR